MRQLLARKLGFNPIRWISATVRMRRRILEFRTAQAARPDATAIAVIVMPVLGTAVPWFSLVFGLFLAARASRVTLVLDDLPFAGHLLRSRFVTACIRSVLRLLRGRHEIVRLSAYRSAQQPSAEDCRWIERLAQLNAIWALRGEIDLAGRRAYAARLLPQLRALSIAVESYLRNCSCQAILVPGGIYGSTGVWAEHARRRAIRVASFDSGGKGVVTLAADGIASQLQDIPRALSLLKKRDSFAAERAFILETARAEMDRRRRGVDRFASQLQSSASVDGRFEGAALVALNSSWDSAALGLHAVFESGMQWVVDTASYLLDRTDAVVIVRQHPAERFSQGRSADDYQGLLAQAFGDNPRLHFIAADDPVNSYDLLSRIGLVIVYTSTIGIEAAALGKVVVTASRSYYSKLGFVWRSENLAQYREHLLAAASGRYQVSTDMRDDAMYCYYLTQCCNWVSSPFSPEGYPEWSQVGLPDLFRDHAVQAMLSSVQQNIPVALLMHQAKLDRLTPPT